MTIIVLDPAPALSMALDEIGDTVVIPAVEADETMWRALVALQTAWRSMRPRGGRIVLVLSTVGMAGAAGAVPYTTAIEGIRAMAKSAARQWGSAAIGVNIIAAPARLFATQVDASHLTVAAVQGDEKLIQSIVETAMFLLRPDIEHVTGETIVVDGGSVMLP